MKFYRTIITIVCLLCLLSANSQQTKPEIDSLLRILQSSSDTVKLKTYTKIIAAYSNISFEKCVEYSLKRYELAQQLNNLAEVANSLTETGMYTFYSGNTEKAIEYFKQSIVIANQIKSKKQVAKLYSNIGAMQEVLGRYDSAMIYYQQSLEIFELQDDKSGSAFVINNMGIVSEELGNHQNAINYYNRSLKLKLNLKDKKGAASTYNNLGVVYENLQENQQALDYYQKALDIFTSLNNNKGIATLLNNIGHIYKLEKKYNKAIENYSKSLKIRTELGDAEGIASTKSYLGIIYLETNDLNKAEKFLLESYQMASQLNSAKFLIQNSEQLASLYHAKGNNYKAYTWHKSFALLRDSLQGIEQKNKIAELETKYETEKKEQTIKTLEIESELKDAEIQKIYLIFIVLFVFGGFVATAIWLYYRQKKLQNEKNSLLLEQKLLRSQMNPHFIFNSLSLIQSFIYDNQPKSAVKYLSAFAKLIRLILENSRQEFIALDNEIETLEHYLELQKMRYMQKFDYQIIIPQNLDIISYKLPPMLIQPFVENAIKHGILQKEGTGLIFIEFKLENNLLCVNIEDNGIGRAKSAEINNKETDKNSSMATKITEERLLNLNRFRKQKIRFEIADLKNELGNASGTKVLVEIPLDN